eukprot:PhM_4_TR9936/c0_g1_i1/m.5920
MMQRQLQVVATPPQHVLIAEIQEMLQQQQHQLLLLIDTPPAAGLVATRRRLLLLRRSLLALFGDDSDVLPRLSEMIVSATSACSGGSEDSEDADVRLPLSGHHETHLRQLHSLLKTMN